jgi:mRNA interferase MazF
MIDYSQYQIVIVNLDPTVGSEIKKKRPCVIVSPNEMNKHLATVVVCPITSQSKNYPTRVHFELEGDTNWVVVDQIRTIDKSRVMKAIGYLDDDAILQVKKCIREAYVD